ncbi:hypothetical protein Drorol1_Dr00024905 [Drosera rotundifolia]
MQKANSKHIRTAKNMSSANMAPIIMIIMIIMAGASWNEAVSFNDGAKKAEYISEEAAAEEDAALVLDRFRVLLGLKSFHKLKPGNAGASPSPSPSPAPVERLHVRPHHRRPHLYAVHPAAYKLHKQDERRYEGKRVLVAILVAIGSTVVICAAVLIWASWKYCKHRKKWRKLRYGNTSSGGSIEKTKNVASLNLASKVRQDPGFDPFYVEALATVLDPQACVKGHSSYLTTSSIQKSSTCTLHDMDNFEHESHTLESGVGSFSTAEAEDIISIHEYADSVKYPSKEHIASEVDKKIKPESRLSDDDDDDDDESFYSVCGSESFNVRFSNASFDSLGCISKDISSKVPSTSHDPLSSQVLTTAPTSNSNQRTSDPGQKTLTILNHLNCQNDSKLMRPPPPPPTPPPPPPPPYLTKTLTTPSFPKPIKALKSENSGSFRLSQPAGCHLDHSLKNHEPLRAPAPCPPPATQQNPIPIKGTPPPPPPRFPQFTTQCKYGLPLPKLKPLHWDKVRAAPDRSTVWDKLSCSSFELDEEMIESLFGYNIKTALANDEGKSKTPSPSKHVLDPKRLQNITILSKALNVTAEHVCNALIQGDGLSLQQLEALAKMAPTKEEEDKLSNYKGDANELGSAEKLVKAMLSIPHTFQRIEAMLFKATFDDEVVHLRNSLSMLEEACKELRSSRLFLKLLEAVLKTGNRMNVGTIRGGAKAFKLDALLKLADVKGTDGKTTLLHFVVQEIVRSEGIRMSESIIGKINLTGKNRTVEEKEEDYRRMGLDLVSGLSAELYNVKKTASIDLDVLASSVLNLSDGISKMQKLSRKDLFNNATARNFVQVINMFMSHAEKNLKELRRHEDTVLQSVREITEYFHGDVSRDEVNPLRIFVIVRDFLGMLDQVCRELKSSKTPKSPNPLAPFR